MGANIEDTLMIHKNEIVYYDAEENVHYRLNPDNIVKVTYDYMEIKRFFGLKKEVIEVMIFDLKGEDLPERIEIREDVEPNLHRYMGGVHSFTDDNKIPLEIKRYEK